MNVSISVIVPIYNVERYIYKCLDSIKNQTFKDFEVILVNDGTPDGSMEIAAKFAAEDARFRIFDKENGGLSDARNFGIRQSRGDYIAFVDSDDYLHPDYLKTLYDACEKNGADMSCCRYLFSYRDGKFFGSWLFNARKRVVSSERGIKMLINDVFLQNMAWSRLCRRELFTRTGVEFPDMYYEDIATTSRLLYNGSKLAITGKRLYYYAIHGGSITQTKGAKLINDYMRSLLVICNFFRFNGQYEKYRKQIFFDAWKVYIANLWQILVLHICAGTLGGMGKNFSRMRKDRRYITSAEFVPTDSFPELPFPIIEPVRKKDRKKSETE
ncbi:MAG: glycosyltransferase [Clostridia bacterium]|nr:glycosyltransferase [Clostridia bacterium]